MLTTARKCDLFIGSELAHSNVVSFLKEEGFSEMDAETLGVHLEIPKSTIQNLKSDHLHDEMGLLHAIIDNWLECTEPSLDKLSEALIKSNYEKIAEKILGD